ncbi:hypothetical protein GCM10010424_51090 [Streptomyces lienomycini]
MGGRPAAPGRRFSHTGASLPTLVTLASGVDLRKSARSAEGARAGGAGCAERLTHRPDTPPPPDRSGVAAAAATGMLGGPQETDEQAGRRA